MPLGSFCAWWKFIQSCSNHSRLATYDKCELSIHPCFIPLRQIFLTRRGWNVDDDEHEHRVQASARRRDIWNANSSNCEIELNTEHHGAWQSLFSFWMNYALCHLSYRGEMEAESFATSFRCLWHHTRVLTMCNPNGLVNATQLIIWQCWKLFPDRVPSTRISVTSISFSAGQVKQCDCLRAAFHYEMDFHSTY